MESAVASCRQFADNYKSGRQGGCLLLTGRPGVGKTFLTHCIAKELIDNGHSVIYYSAGELFDKLARSKFGREQDDGEDITSDEYLSSCELLIIDDLGTEMVNSFVGSALFQLLNSRISRGLGIVISTNLSVQELSRTYSERISSRILESFTLVEAFGTDIRVQKRLRQ
jgi:DNA replication protein DnaC